MEMNIFRFRIINLSDDTQVIDVTLKTPYEALTAVQMAEYMHVDEQLAYMDRIRRREQREVQQRKSPRKLLYKLACVFEMG